MNSFIIDIISLFILIIGIISMHNNTLNFKKIAYVILIILIIDLRTFLNQLFEFYKYLTEELSEYIYKMFVEYMTDLKQLYYLYEIKRIFSTIPNNQ